MIRVTRLDRREIALNCDLIESIEAKPDTTIRLVTGLSLVVRETLDDVLERIQAWRASVLQRAGLAGLSAAPSGTFPLQLVPLAEAALAGVEDGLAHLLTEIPA